LNFDVLEVGKQTKQRKRITALNYQHN